MTLPTRHAVVLGNGFIGSAIAAALTETFTSVSVVARRRRDADSLLATRHIARIHARSEGLRVIHISSGGTVYGESPLNGSLESDLTLPSGNYGLMHSRLEKDLLSHSVKDGTDLVIARVGNPYGPNQKFKFGQGFVALATERIKNGLPLTLVDDGDQVRDYVHIDDVGRGISALATTPRASGIYNIGTSTGTSARRVGELIASTLGLRANFISVPGRSFDVRQNILNNARITAETAIEFTHLDEGLRRVFCQLSAGAR